MLEEYYLKVFNLYLILGLYGFFMYRFFLKLEWN